MLAMLAATVIPTQCIEHGWFCPVPLTGDLCIDVPGNSFCEFYYKTAANISSLYQLDAFDWTVLIIYFGILAVLAIYGVYRIKLVAEFWRYSKFPPKPKGQFAESGLPTVTIQLVRLRQQDTATASFPAIPSKLLPPAASRTRPAPC